MWRIAETDVPKAPLVFDETIRMFSSAKMDIVKVDGQLVLRCHLLYSVGSRPGLRLWIGEKHRMHRESWKNFVKEHSVIF